jgi:hypothetical protein
MTPTDTDQAIGDDAVGTGVGEISAGGRSEFIVFRRMHIVAAEMSSARAHQLGRI